ncbi:conserved hypothetical protein [Chlamydia pneumoniae LPCoLN]|uniref:hypothetical protein n=1 Tax=Chlamydia pneumoniae TaxID=83558 RepID=UPI0001BD9CEC|nr:hypothetical protein [Chlamydia pneumoniae]ACZ33203.1 conserved hypothetical protein [Chlamydia pneumoniae LPCoLN]ETR80114.1 hypothetical protein X556_0566 [Chlamydia pneumoniae B21]
MPYYANTLEFIQGTQSLCPLFKYGFVRHHNKGQLEIEDASHDWDFLEPPSTWKRTLLAAIPILGSIIGLGRLFSIWSIREPQDSQEYKSIFWHTLCAVLEILGLGIVALILKILATFIMAMPGLKRVATFLFYS